MRIFALPTFIIAFAYSIGCSPADRLDYVAASIDRWGTVSISGATIIEPDPRFELDLNLTGNQIFERNRLEGFSNILQSEAMNVEISTRAELVAGMLNQMQTTTEPKLLEQLRRGLLAAAFEGLLKQLPEDQQALFRKSLAPLGGALGPAGDSEASTGSDYGEGERLAGDRALTAAAGELSEPKDLKSQLDTRPEGTSDEQEKRRKEQLLAEIRAAAISGMAQLGAAAQSYVAAATSAVGGAIDAERRVSTLPAAERESASGSLTVAKGARDAAAATQASAEALNKDVESRIDPLVAELESAAASPADKAGTTVAAAIAAMEPLLGQPTEQIKQTGPSVRTQVADAVSKGRQAAALAGAPIGLTSTPQSAPERPKPLTAQPIDRARLQAAKTVGTTFRPGFDNPDSPLSLNLKALLALAASDKSQLEMLRWLSYPRGYAPGKRVFLCMATVNIVPGRQTYRGYYGQVDLYIEYASRSRMNPATGPSGTRHNAQPGVGSTDREDHGPSVERMRGRHPITFAVYPLADAQVLDLRTSRRALFTAALQLALTGYPAAADIFLDYARKTEQDVQTITAVNTVSSYSTGSHLGFTFAPSLVAQSDPANMRTGPQMALQPQTFPVMLLIICDEDELAPRGNADHLMWFQTARWRRVPDPSSDAWPLVGRPLSELAFPRLTEQEVAARALALDAALGGMPTQSGFYSATLRDRINELGARGASLPVTFRLPVMDAGANSGTSIEVHPGEGWVNRPSTFFVKADGMPFDRDYLVTIGGKAVNASRLSNSVLQVVVPPWIESFDYEVAENIAQDARYRANLVVTNGNVVIPHCRAHESKDNHAMAREHGDPACKCLRFVYYAPTPVTAAGGRPTTDAGLTLPEVRVDPAHSVLYLSDESAQARQIVLTLSRPVHAQSGMLTLRTSDPPIRIPVTVAGQSANSSPVVLDLDANKSIPAKLNELVAANKLVDGMILELDFKTDQRVQLPVIGGLQLKEKR